MPKTIGHKTTEPEAAELSPRKTGKKAGAKEAAPAPVSEGRRPARAAVPPKAKGREASVPKAAAPEGRARTTARRPAAKTFLVAATVPGAAGTADLHVYAAVTRGTEEALAAVRDSLGPDVAVELTGKLSGRMARALSLKPGDVRRI